MHAYVYTYMHTNNHIYILQVGITVGVSVGIGLVMLLGGELFEAGAARQIRGTMSHLVYQEGIVNPLIFFPH